MSQYLEFNMVNDSQITELGYYCTSAAREIESFGAFPYTEDAIEVTDKMLKEYLSLIKEKVDNTISMKTRYLKEREELKELLLKAQTTVAYNSLKEDLNENSNSIEELEKIIEEYEDYLSTIESYAERAKENNAKLTYRNC